MVHLDHLAQQLQHKLQKVFLNKLANYAFFNQLKLKIKYLEDFTTVNWINNMVEGETVTRTVDGTEFTIQSISNTIYINNFPVTENDWTQVIKGKTVTLTNEKQETATLTKKGNTILFNNEVFTGGNEVTNQITSEPYGPGGSSVPLKPNKPHGRSETEIPGVEDPDETNGTTNKPNKNRPGD